MKRWPPPTRPARTLWTTWELVGCLVLWTVALTVMLLAIRWALRWGLGMQIPW